MALVDTECSARVNPPRRVRPMVAFLQAAHLRRHPIRECWPPALCSEIRPGPRRPFLLGFLAWAYSLLAGLSSATL